LRVRWAEVDPQNIVFNAHYLMYFDVAATEYWREIGCEYPARFLAHGVDTFVEIGPGQVLSRLIRRISGDVKAISLNDAVVALLGQREDGTGK